VSVLLVNQSFWPDVVATAQQAHDLAKFLESRGDRVTVVASRSLYGKKGSRLPSTETKDGVEVHRVSYNLFDKKGLVSRALDYLRFNVAAACHVLRLSRHDVVICLTTPPFVALIGVLVKAIKGTRFIFWTMDLYPDLPVKAGIISRNGVAHRCMRDRIIDKGIATDRIAMIHPWSDPDEIPELPVRRLELAVDSLATQRPTAPVPCGPNPLRTEWELGDRFVIQYSGNFGLGHDAETVFGAMLKLKEDDGIRWVIVGDGVMRPVVDEFVRKHDIRNVVLKPYQPRSRLGTLISLGDVHLVLMVPGFEGVILPSKLYGILAAGRPAIFVGPERSEIARIIKEDNCGIVVPNGNSEGLVRVLGEIRRDPALGLSLGHRGRKALEAKYSMRHACEAWYRLIHGLADGRTGGPS